MKRAGTGYEIVVLAPRTSYGYVMTRDEARRIARWVRDALKTRGSVWDQSNRVIVRPLPRKGRGKSKARATRKEG